MQTKHDMKAILGEDFFKEEVRCDYLVSAKMKKIWAVILDCYLEFVRICDKYGLRYYAYGGTLLGAIRHKGFIPWDDDFDVCMPREDYEKLLKIAQDELTEPFLMLTPFTDPNCYITMAKLVNKKTTYISTFFIHAGYTSGIAIDIFPLDNYCEATNEQDLNAIRLSAKRCSQYMKRNDTDKMTPEQYSRWKAYMTDNPMQEWMNIQQIASKWNNTHTESYSMKVYVLSETRYNNPLKKEWFSPVEKACFEGIDIIIPSGYDNILKTTYGNYMEFPPVDCRGTWHLGAISDPDRPQTYYL